MQSARCGPAFGRTWIATPARARRLLLDLRRVHDGARIVAFSAHAATAEALYRALRRERGVALLTARGARTAGGLRPREDVLRALEGGDRCAGASGVGLTCARTPRRRQTPAASARDEISLVIATDLLSEGVNLQGASVIVHLDVPWNPAGLDQRVGRAARMGSRHALVHVHGFAPSAATERLLTLERRFREEARGASRGRVPAAGSRALEGGRAIVARRCRRAASPAPGQVVAHAWASPRRLHGGRRSARRIAHRVRRARTAIAAGDSASHPVISATWPAPSVRAAPSRTRSSRRRARAALMSWLTIRRARESAGGALAPSRARRRLLARIDVAVSRAGARARAALAARIAHTHALIDAAISAGDERILDELARDADSRDSGLESLLAACEDRLTHGARASHRPGDARPHPAPRHTVARHRPRRARPTAAPAPPS